MVRDGSIVQRDVCEVVMVVFLFVMKVVVDFSGANWRKLKKYLPKASIFSSVPLNKCIGIEEFPPAGR